MPEQVRGSEREVILFGVGDRELKQICDELLIPDGVDLAALIGPDGAVIGAREAANRVTKPNDPAWVEAVATLFDTVDVARGAIERIGVTGFNLRRMGPTLPNPEYEPLTADDNPFGDRQPGTLLSAGKSMYRFLAQPVLINLAAPHNRQEFPGGLGDLAVSLQFQQRPAETDHRTEGQRTSHQLLYGARRNPRDW